jgi:hypothetical protein
VSAAGSIGNHSGNSYIASGERCGTTMPLPRMNRLLWFKEKGRREFTCSSTSGRRRFGAPLTTGWAEMFGSPNDLEGHPVVNKTAVNGQGKRKSFGCPSNFRNPKS